MELLKRVISAAILISILVVFIILGGYYMVVLAAIVAVLMMFDVTGVLKKGELKPQRIVLLLTSLAIVPAVMFKQMTGYFLLVAAAFSVMTVCVIFSKKPDFKSLISSFFALVYPLMPATLLVYLTVRDVVNSNRIGIILCVGAVLCAALSDTFAYFFGKFFGKRKLCPQISPKKTIVGSVASFFGGAVGGVIMGLFLAEALAKEPVNAIELLDWIILGIACGGFSQIGDLTASMLKRYCNVKDYGNYIPGHGGIMDRMDSIITCLIAIVVYLQIFIPELL